MLHLLCLRSSSLRSRPFSFSIKRITLALHLWGWLLYCCHFFFFFYFSYIINKNHPGHLVFFCINENDFKSRFFRSFFSPFSFAIFSFASETNKHEKEFNCCRTYRICMWNVKPNMLCSLLFFMVIFFIRLGNC